MQSMFDLGLGRFLFRHGPGTPPPVLHTMCIHFSGQTRSNQGFWLATDFLRAIDFHTVDGPNPHRTSEDGRNPI